MSDPVNAAPPANERRAFQMKREITVGDLLTIITIIISVITLNHTFNMDREERNRQQANQIRSAATETLAKIERWQEASLRYYQNLEPEFVDTSLMIAKDNDLKAARDFLWKKLSEDKAGFEQKQFEEKIETSYASLFIYHQSEQQIFLVNIKQMKQVDEEEFDSFREDVQGIINEPIQMSFYMDPYGKFKTDEFYRELIKIAGQHSKSLQEKFNPAATALNSNLLGIINKTDEEIVNRK